MLVERIDILNFKNIAEASLEFSSGVNCLLGLNGMGKSNLLEAIHFLSMARPIRSVPESALIRHGEEMLMVKGNYTMDTGASESVSCGIVKGKGKTLRRNGKEYQRISEHIGKFPIVTVTGRPGDCDRKRRGAPPADGRGYLAGRSGISGASHTLQPWPGEPQQDAPRRCA